MSTRQAWILVGIAGAVLAFGYLATQREVNATVTAGEATLTYKSMDGGAAAAATPQENSHDRMMRLIEESQTVLEANP